MPKVQVVLVGAPVSFPNNDDVRHHVYSFSSAKRFALPLYVGVPVQPVVFDKPGVVISGATFTIGWSATSTCPNPRILPRPEPTVRRC